MDTIPQDTPLKQCTKCQQIKPCVEFGFDRQSQKYRSHCKACCREYGNRYYAQGPLNKRTNVFSSETEKQCTKCMQILSLADFYKDSKGVNGLCAQCKTCRNAFHKLNYREHKEARVIQKAQYYREHKSEEHNRRIKRYHEHGGYERVRYSRYIQTERGRIVRKAIDHRYRARKRNAFGSFTSDQFQQQTERQKYRCYYCNKQYAKSAIWHADHVIPLSRGGSNDISNIVATCPTCNIRKKDKLPHEFFEGGRLV